MKWKKNIYILERNRKIREMKEYKDKIMYQKDEVKKVRRNGKS